MVGAAALVVSFVASIPHLRSHSYIWRLGRLVKVCPHYKQVCTTLQQHPVPNVFLRPHWHNAEPAPHDLRGLNSWLD